MLYMINKKKLTISENVEILIIFTTHNQNKLCNMKGYEALYYQKVIKVNKLCFMKKKTLDKKIYFY